MSMPEKGMSSSLVIPMENWEPMVQGQREGVRGKEGGVGCYEVCGCVRGMEGVEEAGEGAGGGGGQGGRETTEKDE